MPYERYFQIIVYLFIFLVYYNKGLKTEQNLIQKSKSFTKWHLLKLF